MTLETVLIWIVVGLVAGVLASFVVGSGFGLLGDIVIGIAGAVFGGWIVQVTKLNIPVSGLPGTILVALGGAILLLLIIGLIRRGTRPRRL